MECPLGEHAASLTSVSSGFRFPFDLWLKITAALVNDPASSPQRSILDRAAIASVSKDWQDGVYHSPIFWSHITVFHDLSIRALKFYVAKCGNGPMHVRLALRDLYTIGGMSATAQSRQDFVDSIFLVLSSTSNRWMSFAFETESPIVFKQVSDLCYPLDVSSLRDLEVSYLCMPAYGGYPTLPPVAHVGQRLGLPWFAVHPPHLMRTSAFCVRLSAETYRDVKEVELADCGCTGVVPIELLLALFDFAEELLRLRIGAIPPFPIPVGFSLRSLTLTTLDIEFHRGVFVGALFASLDVPSLVDLTVRDVYDYVYCLLARPDILSRLLTFRVYSEIGDYISLSNLYTYLTRLEVLDLTHAGEEAFEIYREWALSRVQFGQSCLAGSLRALYLPRVDWRSVVEIVNLVAEHNAADPDLVGIHTIRLDKPDNYEHMRRELHWLFIMVPDFAVTFNHATRLPYVVSGGMASRLLRSPTAHTWIGQQGYTSAYAS